MSDAIQNVKIKFTSDTSGLAQANKEVQNLSKAEQDAVRGFKAMNDAGIAANKAIQIEAKKTATETDKVTKSASNLNAGFKNVAGTIVAAFSVGAIIGFGKQIFNVTAQFEKLRAVLTNTLGSANLADSALSMIGSSASPVCGAMWGGSSSIPTVVGFRRHSRTMFFATPQRNATTS